MKEFKIQGGGYTYIFKGETEKDAWMALSQLKQLSVEKLKEQFKLVKDDIRTKLDD